MKAEINGIILECVKGNIAGQDDFDAVVNAANAELRMGGGVAGAIHRTAGPELEKECLPLGPIKPGVAVITRAYKLPNQHVIHCLGPVYRADKPSDKLLANCYRNAIKIAEENDITSIAFPAIATGIFGYPKEAAAKIALETIIAEIPKMKSIKIIRMVLHSNNDLEIHEQILSTLIL